MMLYESYFILFNYVIFSILLVFIILLLTLFISKNPFKFDFNKNSIYECGFDTFLSTRTSFEIHFYLVGILFIIFDLEIAFLFPWVICFNYINFIGFWSMYFFLFLLILGFYYELKNNILDW